jgi:hypothetical protein
MNRVALLVVTLSAALVPPTKASAQAETPAIAIVPRVDHHQHLLSPALAGRLFELPAAIELPPELHRRFREGAPRFNDTTALAELYTQDAVLVFSFAPQGAVPETWVRGRQRIASFLAGAFRNISTPSLRFRMASTALPDTSRGT